MPQSKPRRCEEPSQHFGYNPLRYLRYERQFQLLATGPWGRHRCFESEVEIRDVHAVPIRFHGYKLSFRGGRVWVRIGQEDLGGIRERLLRRAVRARVWELVSEFHSLPYEPYRSVRYQMFGLLDEVNRPRRAAGLACVPQSAIPDRRTSYRVFKPAGSKSQTMGKEFRESKYEQAEDTAEVSALG